MDILKKYYVNYLKFNFYKLKYRCHKHYNDFNKKYLQKKNFKLYFT